MVNKWMDGWVDRWMDEWIEQKKREEWERDHFHLRKPFLHIKS